MVYDEGQNVMAHADRRGLVAARLNVDLSGVPEEEPGYVGRCSYCHELICEPHMSHADHCEEYDKWVKSIAILKLKGAQ